MTIGRLRARAGCACQALRLVRLGLAGLALLLLAAAAPAEVPVPKLAARVTDLTATLGAEQRAALEAKLAAFEQRKGAQIAVLLVPTTQPEAIEQYARRVMDEWKLGRKGVDDGALLLIAKDDRKLRIETQYGLEGPLPDAVAKRIVAEIIAPRFRQQDFYGGIVAGVDRMIAVVDGEPLPPPQRSSARSNEPDGLEALLMLGFVMLFFVGAVLRAMFGRVGGAGVTAGAGGVIAWIIAGSLLAAGVVAVVLFLGSLLLGAASTLRASGRSGGSWGGGSWGGGSWGGGGGWSGGGDWSGGGGSGGGGGASGSW